jgi:branched-chain amino acid transport system permease protein
MKVINFAMGEFLMVGVYMTWLFQQIFGWDNYALIVFVVPACAIIAFVVFQLFIKPILGKSSETFILVTVGLSFILQNLAQLLFGSYGLIISSEIQNSAVKIGTLSVGAPRLVALVVGLALVLAVYLFINRTNMGRKMRATAENTDIAATLGINTTRIYAFAFILSLVLAGISGLLVSSLYYATPWVGARFKSYVMMAVVMGGLGNIQGALISGLCIGLIEQLVALFFAQDLGPVGIFVMFLVVLIVKPHGLFSKEGRMA